MRTSSIARHNNGYESDEESEEFDINSPSESHHGKRKKRIVRDGKSVVTYDLGVQTGKKFFENVTILFIIDWKEM